MDISVQTRFGQVTYRAPPDSPEHADTVRLLYDIVNRRTLATLYQPIVDLRDCTLLGHEGLIRGPSDTVLHSPTKLLRAAHELGLGFEMETLCARMLTRRFADLGLPGKLFINFTPDVLMKHSLGGDHDGAEIWCDGLEPGRVVIELTEHGFNTAYGIEMLLETARAYRTRGFEVAIDDLGEGSSNLRLWSELRPDFIKIDRHFIQGIDKDSVKAQFVRSIQEIAYNAGSKVIAEGIETRAELAFMTQLGIGIGQGYFIGHPLPAPSTIIAAEVVDTLGGGCRRHLQRSRPEQRSPIERDLLLPVTPVDPDTTNEEVFRRFEAEPTLLALPVVDTDGIPLGLINRYHLIGCFARPYYHELYDRKSCRALMDERPLKIDKSQSIQELGALLANSAAHHVVNGFLITDNGSYLGIGTTQDLVRVITTMQINAARHANPLTQLPGNGPINDTIEQWLREDIEFVVCYFDLDHFKPFNDVYGFAKGDDIIKLTGRILTETTNGEQDFVGHIGGDDFIVLFRSHDWEARCRLALAKFAEGIADYFSPDDRERGGYLAENRRGEMEFHPVTALSIGAVEVRSGMFSSRLEIARVAAESKKKAKAIVGNSLFINQRQYQAEHSART